MSLVLLDLDRFKAINDTYGHDAGDAVLVECAKRLRDHARQHIDVAARIGGEEMGVLLPATSPEYAVVFAERLRTVIATTPFILPDGTQLAVTASFGVATASGGSAETLLKAADVAVYEAKAEGRNRVRGNTGARVINAA